MPSFLCLHNARIVYSENVAHPKRFRRDFRKSRIYTSRSECSYYLDQDNSQIWQASENNTGLNIALTAQTHKHLTKYEKFTAELPNFA
jgi:hypothetical protein